MPSDWPRWQVDAEASLPVRSEPQAGRRRPAGIPKPPTLVETRTEYKAARLLLAADSETPVLLTLLLACWRWLMPTATGVGASRHAARALQDEVPPAAMRPGPRLAHIHAPPHRLLT